MYTLSSSQKKILNAVSLLLVIGTSLYFFPFIQFQRKLTSDAKIVTSWITAFSPQQIGATCSGIPQNRYYYDCFVPQAKKIIGDNDLGGYGISLVISKGSQVIEDAKYPRLEHEFAGLHLSTLAVVEISNYEPHGRIDQQARNKALQVYLLAISKLTTIARQDIDRMPAGVTQTQYLASLNSYEQVSQSYTTDLSL